MSARHEPPSHERAPETYSGDQSARQAILAAATPRTTPLRPRGSRSRQPEFKWTTAAAVRSGQSGERARAQGREQSKVPISTVHGQTMRSFDQSRTSRDARDVNLQVLEGRRASERRTWDFRVCV